MRAEPIRVNCLSVQLPRCSTAVVSALKQAILPVPTDVHFPSATRCDSGIISYDGRVGADIV